MTASVLEPSRTYVLRLLNELLALENSISRGVLPFPAEELAGRLLFVDRLLTAPLEDLATLGMPVPLPTAATIIRATLERIEERRLRWAQTLEHPPERGATAS